MVSVSLCPDRELVSLDRYCSDRGVSVVPALEVPAGTPLEALYSARTDMDSFVGCFSDVRYGHGGVGMARVWPLAREFRIPFGSTQGRVRTMGRDRQYETFLFVTCL